VVEVDNIVSILALIGAAVLAFFLGKGRLYKRKGSKAPPKNTAANVAIETVQQTFEEEVDGVFKAVEGEDPAGDLADQGNARRRH
jgi:hypothetical protein